METSDKAMPSTKDCFAHLDREEAFLTETLGVLRAIHQALVARDGKELTKLLDRQQQLESTAQELFGRRHQFRQVFADVSQAKLEDVTLSRIARHMSTQFHDEFERRRATLASLVGEVQNLQRANASLIHHSIHVLNLILAGVGGRDTSETRYASSGRVEFGSQSPLLQTKC